MLVFEIWSAKKRLSWKTDQKEEIGFIINCRTIQIVEKCVYGSYQKRIRWLFNCNSALFHYLSGKPHQNYHKFSFGTYLISNLKLTLSYISKVTIRNYNGYVKCLSQHNIPVCLPDHWIIFCLPFSFKVRNRDLCFGERKWNNFYEIERIGKYFLNFLPIFQIWSLYLPFSSTFWCTKWSYSGP